MVRESPPARWAVLFSGRTSPGDPRGARDHGARVEKIALSETQRGSLVAPIEWKTRVDHQLTGGEVGGLFSRQDRSDDIGGEEGQPRETRCVRGVDILFASDVLQGRTASLEQSLADPLGSNKQSDQAGVRRS